MISSSPGRNIFWKNSFCLFVRVKSYDHCAEICLKELGVDNILDFNGFTFPKFVIHNKIINKTRTQIDPETSTHLLFLINCNKLQPLKKYFWKKFLLLIYASKILWPLCWNLFKRNGSWDILDFNGFTFPKFVIHNKIINKMRTEINPEYSTQCFWGNYQRKLSRENFRRKSETVERWNFLISNVYYFLK